MSWHKFADHRDRIVSKSGEWIIGGGSTLHSYNIQQDLVQNASWMQCMLLSVTGKLYPTNIATFVEALFVVTGYPDPRLWCNRVGALAGSSQCSAAASIATSISSAEGMVYGGQAIYKSSIFLQKAHSQLFDNGGDALSLFVDDYLSQKKTIFGFGRPLTNTEERIHPIIEKALSLGLNEGRYCLVAKNIESYLQARSKNIILNFGGYIAAWLLDLGFKSVQIYHIQTLLFYNGMVPCYIEAFENEPGTFLPIACEDILYEGVEERELP